MAKSANLKKSDNQVNLVDLHSDRNKSLPGELNSKIGSIDSNLDDLGEQLSQINKDFNQRLSTLDESGSDLSSRVAETFSYLTDTNERYQILASDSSDIKDEIKTLALDLKKLAGDSGDQILDLTENHEALLERVSELSKKSKATARKLDKSISENVEIIQELESRLSGEIDTLAREAKDRDENLANENRKIWQSVKKAETDLEGHNARMLKMAAVDDVLAKRASTLENSTSELSKASKDLYNSTRSLDRQSKNLAKELAALQEQTELHSGFITDIQEHASTLASRLSGLANLEKRHFFISTGLALVLLLLLGGFYWSQQANWKSEAIADTTVNSEVQRLNTDVENLERNMENMKDQAQSLDGRVSNISSFTQFGKDNIIHGPQWIAGQASDGFVIHIATATDKAALYDIVQRNGSYLKDTLAYVPVKTGQGNTVYALIYGNYESHVQASSVLNDLPYRINWQQPSIQAMAAIQRDLY